MSVRDGAAHVESAVRSICSQTFSEFEFVILDDGSTDDTPRILRAIQRADRRLRCYTHEPQGLIASLNRGFGLVRGRYIARMDADDVALPHRLERQVAYFDEHPETAMLGSAMVLIDAHGRPFDTVIYPTEDAIIKQALQCENCFAHPTVMLRADVVRQMQGFRPGFIHAEDYELWMRIAERHPVANLAEPLLHYRVHFANVTHRHLRDQVKAILAIQAASRIRRATGTDPMAHDENPTSAVLARLGVSGSEADALLYDACLGWAKYLAAAGGRCEALELLDEAMTLARQRPDRRAATALALLARAQVLFRLGLRPQAAFALCSAVAVDPRRARRLLAERVRSRLSRVQESSPRALRR